MLNNRQDPRERKALPPDNTVVADAEGSQEQDARVTPVVTEESPAARAVWTLQDIVGNELLGAALGGRELDGFGPVVADEMTAVVAGLESPGLFGSNEVMARLMRRSAELLDTEAAFHDIRSSSGRRFDTEHRERFEEAFDHEFQHVRIHTDAAAMRAAEALDAHAFALGADVFFGPGAYEPGTAWGDRLLAHELTHVVQSDQGRIPRTGEVSSPSDPHEREAYANESVMLRRLEAIDAALDEAVPEAVAQRMSAVLGEAPTGLQITTERDESEDIGGRPLFGTEAEVSAAAGPVPQAGQVREAMRAGVVDDDLERAAQTRALLGRLARALGLPESSIVVQADEDSTRRVQALGTRGVMEGGRVLLDAGAYDPTTADGRALLAHEVMHVAQDRLPGDTSTAEVTSGDLVEGEAQTFAEAFAGGHATPQAVMAMPEGHSAQEGGGAAAHLKDLYAQFDANVAAKKSATDSASKDKPDKGSVAAPVQDREEKLEQYEDGLESVADEIEDTDTFDDLCEAIDDEDSAETERLLNRIRTNSYYKDLTDMWQGAMDGEEDAAYMKRLYDNKFDGRGFYAETEEAWAMIARRAKRDAKENAEAEAAKAELEKAKGKTIPGDETGDEDEGSDVDGQGQNGAGGGQSPQDMAKQMAGVEVPSEFPGTPEFEKAWQNKTTLAPKVTAEVGHYESHVGAMKSAGEGGFLSRGEVVMQELWNAGSSGFVKGFVDGFSEGLILDTIGDAGDLALKGITKGKMPKASYVGSAISLYQSGLIGDVFSGDIFSGKGKFVEGLSQNIDKIGQGFSKGSENWEKAQAASGIDAFGLYCAAFADWIGAAAGILDMVSNILGTLSAICYVVGGILIIAGLCLMWLGIGAGMISAGTWLVRAGNLLDKVKKVIDPIVDILKGVAFFLRLLAAFTVPADAFADQVMALGDETQAYSEKKGTQMGTNTANEVKDSASKPFQPKNDKAGAPEDAKVTEGSTEGQGDADKKKQQVEQQLDEMQKGKELLDKAQTDGGEPPGPTSKRPDDEATDDPATANKKKEVTQEDVDKVKTPKEKERGFLYKVTIKNFQSTFKSPVAKFKEVGDNFKALRTDFLKWKNTPELHKYEQLSQFDDLDSWNPITGRKKNVLGPDSEMAQKAMQQVGQKKSELKAEVDKAYHAAVDAQAKVDDLRSQLADAESNSVNVSPQEYQARLQLKNQLKDAEKHFLKLQKGLDEADKTYTEIVDLEKKFQQQQFDQKKTPESNESAQKKLTEEQEKLEKSKKEKSDVDLELKKLKDQASTDEQDLKQKQAELEHAKKYEEAQKDLLSKKQQKQKLEGNASAIEKSKKLENEISDLKKKFEQRAAEGGKVGIPSNETKSGVSERTIKEVRDDGVMVSDGKDTKFVPWSQIKKPNFLAQDANALDQKSKEKKNLDKQVASDMQGKDPADLRAQAENIGTELGTKQAEFDAMDKPQPGTGAQGLQADVNLLMKGIEDNKQKQAELTGQSESLDTQIKDQEKSVGEAKLAVDGPNKDSSDKGGFAYQVLSQPESGKGFNVQVTKDTIGVVLGLLKDGTMDQWLGLAAAPEKKDEPEITEGKKSKQEKVDAAAASLLQSDADKEKADKEAEDKKGPLQVAGEWWSTKGEKTAGLMNGTLNGPKLSSLLDKEPPHDMDEVNAKYEEAEKEAELFTQHHAQAYNCFVGQQVAAGYITETEFIKQVGQDVVVAHAQAQAEPLQKGMDDAQKRKEQAQGQDMGTKPADESSKSLIQGLLERLMGDGGDYVNDAPGDETADMQAGASGGQDAVDEGAKKGKEDLVAGAGDQVGVVKDQETTRQQLQNQAQSDTDQLQSKIDADKVALQQIDTMKQDNMAKRDEHKAALEGKSLEYNEMFGDMVVWASEYKTKREAWTKAGGA